VLLELLSRGPSVYGFHSTDGVMVWFLCKEGISPEDIHAYLEAQFGDAIYSERSPWQWPQYVRQGREDLRDEV
jgi:hypothetical protein